MERRPDEGFWDKVWFWGCKDGETPQPFICYHTFEKGLCSHNLANKNSTYHLHFCSDVGANKKSKTFVPMKSYLVAKLYPDGDAKRKEKLTFSPHRTKSKTQPTRKRNFEKTFTFTRQIFIFSPPHTVTSLFLI